MRRALVLLLLASHCAGAYAALGSAPSTFSGATSALKARSLAATSGSASTSYTVTASTLDSGTVVREYSSAAGVVFGVTWDGPFLPDLRTLLGSHFTSLTDAAAQRPRAGHSHLSVNTDQLVIVSGGHMRAYNGKAWLPGALPAGFALTDLE
jgi:hypothetical protein